MKILRLPIFQDDARLISTQHGASLPFRVKRTYVIYAVKPGTIRGMHAHKKTKQALFCIQGSVDILLDDGKRKKTFNVRKPNVGVFIDRMVWSKIYNFSSDAILLVFASDYFREPDYIRDYHAFRKLTK